MSEVAVYLSLRISAEEYQKLYAGVAKSVYARALDGRRIRFPANILRPFVTRTGIDGHFAIYFDGQNRFTRIEKVE
ncbi:DUF2835 domain-containing protein [Teredinibacter haidensis]|uniref:DUF2835 domain-containing protein n=1 Tax=Teredinibacter haidensis TaxID=2731755 RepID=UPI0009491BB0|nr:DUF2835 domain-containing protein [Teredinibacter haidensis]